MNNDFDPHKALKDLVAENDQSLDVAGLNNIPIRQYDEGEDVSLVALENALRVAARVIEREGAQYLPYFHRIKAEIEKRKAKMDAMEEVRYLAGSIQTGRSFSANTASAPRMVQSHI